MKIILLRPIEGALQSAQIARDIGLEPIIAPASEIRPLSWDAPSASKFDAIMITSANALRINQEKVTPYRHLPFYAVGQATAKLAKQMGFTIAGLGSGGAKALWPLLEQDSRQHVLRLVGTDHIPIASDKITSIITYKAMALPIHIDLQTLLQKNDSPHIFAFHSARAVQIFADYMHSFHSFDPSQHYAAALAPSIGKALTQHINQPWKEVIISPQADDKAQFTRLYELFGTG